MNRKLGIGLMVVTLAVNVHAEAKPKDTLKECQKRETSYISKIEELDAQVQKYDEELFSISTELFQCKEKYISIQINHDEVSAKYSQCQSDVAGLGNALAQCQNQKEALQDQNESLTQTVSDLTTQVENLSIENTELLNTVTELTNTNAFYMTSYEELLAQYGTVSGDLDELTQKYDEMIKMQNNLKSQVANYENVLSPQVPYVVTGNLECITSARDLLSKFIKKAKNGTRRLKISRKSRKVLTGCQSTETANQAVLETLRKVGVNIK